ncbi:MAG: gliding motility lipoprotein GldH [Bacteroidota bacterium]
MSKKILILVVISTLLLSCDGNRIYEDFVSVNQQSWAETDSLSFDLKGLDLQEKKTLLAIRYNENYNFSNCYIRIISKDSTGLILENKLLNIPLFDSKTGEPLGKGYGSTFTKYDTLPFSLKSTTEGLTLLQYMRVETLPGIEAAGIKVLQ